MLVKIAATLRVFGASDKMRAEILSWWIPDATAAAVQRRAVRRGARDTGDTPRHILAAVDGDAIVLPRGLTARLLRAVDAMNEPVRWVPEVFEHPEPIILPPSSREPRPYQTQAIGKMLERRQGLVVLPCGGGKTFTGALALARLGQPALVTAPTTDIADQWRAAIEAVGLTVVPWRRDAPPLPGEVAVSVEDSVRANDPALQRVGVLIVDEAHRAAAATMRAIVSACPARFRWGLTATPERADGWGPLLPVLFGDVLIEVTPAELVAQGFVMAPKIAAVSTGWAPVPELHRMWTITCPGCRATRELVGGELVGGAWTCPGTRKRGKCGRIFTEADRLDPKNARPGEWAWSAVVSGVADDENRNHLIRLLAERLARAGRRVLVLVPRVDLAKRLARQIGHTGIRCESVTGDASSSARAEPLDRLRSGETRVIVATQLADEGLDVPEIDAVISASPGKAGGKAVQRAGRATRAVDGKPAPIILDLVDAGDLMGRHWGARRAAYLNAWGPACLVSPSPLSVEAVLALVEANPGR